jgi:hypothetical protein
MRGFESKVLTSSGAVKSGAGRVSAISLAAGSDAATVIVDDSTDGSGTDKWKLVAVANAGDSITFPEPILFGVGIYATLTGTGPAVSVAYE